MMIITNDQLTQIKNYEQEIIKIQQKMAEIHPYSVLQYMDNKTFGEAWSETYIKSKVPNLTGGNGKGKDMHGIRYKRIEVKSSRLDFVSGRWTQNQIHIREADAYLFVWYQAKNYKYHEVLCFIPTEDLKKLCHVSPQHAEDIDICCSLGNSAATRNALKQYMLTWEELNERV